MLDHQTEYEKLRLANLATRVSEVRRLSGALEQAVKAGKPLPVTKESLRALSLAARECASIVNDHAIGNEVSNATLRAVALGMFDVYESMNNMILYAAVTPSI